MQRNIVTLDSLVHAKFVAITAAKMDDRQDGYAVTVKPLNDPDADGVTAYISKERAEEIGLATRVLQ